MPFWMGINLFSNKCCFQVIILGIKGFCFIYFIYYIHFCPKSCIKLYFFNLNSI